MEQTTHRPRDTVSVTFCPTCERDDRWATLKARHFWHGAICQGKIVKVVYRHPVIIEADQ